MARSKEREKIITILYQVIMYDRNKINYDLDNIIKENVEETSIYIESSLNGIFNNKNKIEELINKNLNNWTLDRLSPLDSAILINAVYELMYIDTPDIVAINEAVEISKKYSDEKITKMINGVLDKIRLNHE